SERRTPEKRHGFTVYRWTKDPLQANEALDTMLQAETAATNFGVRGLPDAIWDTYEQEREMPTEPGQAVQPPSVKPEPAKPIPVQPVQPVAKKAAAAPSLP